MTEHDDDPNPARVAARRLAKDAMYTVTRIEHPVETIDLDQRIGFRERLILRFLALESHFDSGNWPPLRRRVFVSAEDVNCWGAIPHEWEASLALEGIDPRAETSGPGHQRIERGLDFIRRRVEPLSEDYWLISEAKMIRMVLDAENEDDALDAAFELGSLQEKARQHGLHLHDITKSRRQVAYARSAGATGAEEMQKRAEEWQIIARKQAEEKWSRKPQRSISEVAQEIARDLHRGEVKTARGTLPNKETVRKTISDLKPDQP